MTTTIQLEALFVREIDRCYGRIQECGAREAALGPDYDPKVRAAIDRDRDRAFIGLRRAMKALKELRSDMQREPEVETPVQSDSDHPAKPAEVIEMPRSQVARNALCPCNSGDKYKRCCGRQAPPMTGDFRRMSQPRAA